LVWNIPLVFGKVDLVLYKLQLERLGLVYFVSSSIFQWGSSVLCAHSGVPMAFFIQTLFRCPWLKLPSRHAAYSMFRISLGDTIVYPNCESIPQRRI